MYFFRIVVSIVVLAGCGCRACFVAFFNCLIPLQVLMISYLIQRSLHVLQSAPFYRVSISNTKIQCRSTDSVSAERDGFALRAESGERAPGVEMWPKSRRREGKDDLRKSQDPTLTMKQGRDGGGNAREACHGFRFAVEESDSKTARNCYYI